VLEKLMDIAVLRNENERLKEQLARTQAALAESEEARQRLETIIVDMRREKFGAKSEKLRPNQFHLPLEDVEIAQGVLDPAQEKAAALIKGKSDGAPLGVVRQLHQKMRFRGEGLANAEGILFGAGSIRRQAAAPDIGLSIEVIQISKFAGRKEAGANVSNCTFDPTFFISPGDGDRTRIKSIASSKLEQGVNRPGIAGGSNS
jgi:hypothetical protein